MVPLERASSGHSGNYEAELITHLLYNHGGYILGNTKGFVLSITVFLFVVANKSSSYTRGGVV